MKECKVAEDTTNAPKLLELIKQNVHTNKGAQYEYWALSYAMKKVISLKQGKFESLTAYYNRFIDQVQVTEAQWGNLSPTKMTTTTNTDGHGSLRDSWPLARRSRDQSGLLGQRSNGSGTGNTDGRVGSVGLRDRLPSQHWIFRRRQSNRASRQDSP